MSLKSVRKLRENLRRLLREVTFLNNANCCLGVTLPQCHTLMELNSSDNVTLNELSGRLYLEKSTVCRTIEGLVNLGLVNREIPKDNRRTTRLKLTKQGQAVCTKINSENDKFYGNVLKTIPEENREMFVESFALMVKKIIELNKKDSV